MDQHHRARAGGGHGRQRRVGPAAPGKRLQPAEHQWCDVALQPPGAQQGAQAGRRCRVAPSQPQPPPRLVGNPIADAEKPLEVLRTIHSFDPCIACAIHTLDVDGNEISRVKAL